MVRLIALASVLAMIAGCGAATADPTARATIQFDITPDTARVYTEDRFIGSARVLAVHPPSFRTGPRQITISAEGYFPYDHELDLVPGTTTMLVHLRPIPP
jgi:hypothetical protein